MSDVPYTRISLVYFAYFAVVGALTPYWSLYLDHLGYTPALIGVIVSIPMLTKIIAPNIWGWVADKSGKRLLIARLGAAGSCLCFAGILLDQSTLWFVVCIAAYSFFWNAIHAQFEVVTLGYLKDKPEEYSHVRLWGSVGFIFVVVSLGLLFDFVSVKALPWFIFIFLAGIFFSTLSLPTRNDPPSTRSFSGFIDVLFTRRIIKFFLVLFLIQLTLGVYHGFFSIYMEGLGYNKSVIGLLWAAGAIAEILLFIKAPKFLKRYSLNTLLTVTLSVTLLRWVLTCWFAAYAPVIFLAQCMHAFSFGLTHVVAIEFVRREFGTGNQSQGQAFYNAVGFGAANALGSLIGGLIFEFNGQWAFMFSILVIFLSLIFHLWASKSPANL